MTLGILGASGFILCLLCSIYRSRHPPSSQWVAFAPCPNNKSPKNATAAPSCCTSASSFPILAPSGALYVSQTGLQIFRALRGWHHVMYIPKTFLLRMSRMKTKPLPTAEPVPEPPAILPLVSSLPFWPHPMLLKFLPWRDANNAQFSYRSFWGPLQKRWAKRR